MVGYPNQQSPYLLALPAGGLLLKHTIPMRNISVKELMTEFSFVSVIPQVRRNGNQYPFLTFMNGDNVATNIYFSVGAAALITDTTTVTREFLEGHTVTIYPTPDGEERIKLSRKGDSLRLSFADLFG